LRGWAAGYHGVVLRTEDGGQHWYQVADEHAGYLLGIHFVDGKRGFVVGADGLNGDGKVDWSSADGLVLETDDGGERWTEVSIGRQPEWWFGVHSPDGGRTLLISSEQPVYLRSDDRGQTWSLNRLP